MTADHLRVPLDQRALRASVLPTSPTWTRIDVVAQTGSTNADLAARATAGEDIDGSVLIAEHQTAGRGRQGRTWSAAPYAQITMSFGVGTRRTAPERWGWLPLLTGVAVVDALAPVAVGLKWPNDVVAEGGKLAGILAEVAAPGEAIVVGLGLNVTLRPEEVGEPTATSLVQLGVAAPDRQRLVGRLLDKLGCRIARWRSAAGADAGLIADYRARSVTIGTRVRAILPGERELVGVAADIDELGRLRIDSDGHTTVIAAGDVIHLRPGA